MSKLTIKDYEEVLNDNKRLVRELDKIINGDHAAKQASLVDIVSQLKNDWPLLKEARDMLVLLSLVDKSGQSMELADKIDKRLPHLNK